MKKNEDPQEKRSIMNSWKPKTHYYNRLNRVSDTEIFFPKCLNFWSHTITHSSNFLDSTLSVLF